MTTLYGDLTDPVLELCEKNLKVLRDALAGDLGGKVKLHEDVSDVLGSKTWAMASEGIDGDEDTPYTDGSMCDILSQVKAAKEKASGDLATELGTILDAFNLLGFESAT